MSPFCKFSIRSIASVFLSAYVAVTNIQAATIGDRLILDINGLQYTQRQLESYLLVRAMLLSGSQPASVLAAENWGSSLLAFEQAMMIEQEAFRLGGFQPSELMIKTSMEIIKKKLGTDSDELRQAQRLGLDDKGMERIVASILRAEGLRRSRQRVMSDASVNKNERRSGEDEWLVDLKRRAIVRRYNGADNYLQISPVQR